jgi:hypothetical protein
MARPRALVALLACILPLLACDVTAPVDLSSFIHYSYSGAFNGERSFSNSGPTSAFDPAPFVRGGTNFWGQHSITTIGDVGSDGRTYQLFISLSSMKEGTFQLGSSSCADCASGALQIFGDDPDASPSRYHVAYFTFTGGSVSITSVRDGRLEGVFSGTLIDGERELGLTITDGAFGMPRMGR